MCCLQAGQWLKSVGLVQRSAAIWHCHCMNRVNSHNDSESWCHHDKHCPGIFLKFCCCYYSCQFTLKLSCHTVLSCVLQLLKKKPSERLGMPTCAAGEIRNHIYFKPIDWALIEDRKLVPPFKPKTVSTVWRVMLNNTSEYRTNGLYWTHNPSTFFR